MCGIKEAVASFVSCGKILGGNMHSEESARETIGGFTLLGLVLVGVLSTSVLVSMPVLAPALADHVGGGVAAIGYLSSADWFGSVLAGVIVLFCVDRIAWRLCIAGCLLAAAIGNVACFAADGFGLLYAARFITGAANGGVLAIVFVALCHSGSPDRSFGFYVFAQLALQSIILPVFAWLLGQYGETSLFIALAIMPLVSLPFVLVVPKSLKETGVATGQIGKGLQLKPWAWAVLVALAVYFIAPIMVWSYFEPIGRSFSLSGAETATVLGFSAFAGMAGAVAVLWLSQAEKRSLMILVGGLSSVVAVLILVFGSGYALFLLGACIFNFAWNFTFPYLMGVIAKFDETGAVAILSLIAQILGIAVGPAVGGFLASFGEGFSVILMVSVAIYILSVVVFLTANKEPSTF